MVSDKNAAWIGLSGAAISLVIAVSFVAALIADWSFYQEFGLSYDQVPTSLGDHLRGTIVFLQTAVPALVLAFLVYKIIETALHLSGEKVPEFAEERLPDFAERRLPDYLQWIFAVVGRPFTLAARGVLNFVSAGKRGGQAGRESESALMNKFSEIIRVIAKFSMLVVTLYSYIIVLLVKSYAVFIKKYYRSALRLIDYLLLIFVPMFPFAAYVVCAFHNAAFCGFVSGNLSYLAWFQIGISIFMAFFNYSHRKFSLQRHVVLMSVLIVTGFYMYGKGEALQYIEGAPRLNLIHTTKSPFDPQARILHAYVLRQLEQGLLVCEAWDNLNKAPKNCEENILFLPWGSVVRLDMS